MNILRAWNPSQLANAKSQSSASRSRSAKDSAWSTARTSGTWEASGRMNASGRTSADVARKALFVHNYLFVFCLFSNTITSCCFLKILKILWNSVLLLRKCHKILVGRQIIVKPLSRKRLFFLKNCGSKAKRTRKVILWSKADLLCFAIFRNSKSENFTFFLYFAFSTISFFCLFYALWEKIRDKFEKIIWKIYLQV